MKTWLVTGLLALAMVLSAFQSLPRCTALEPDTGKVGDVIAVKGENLSKGNIADVYLTDGSKDTKASISEQSDTQIKFKVPQIKAGRYHVAMLTANGASMIEQPVVFTVQ